MFSKYKVKNRLSDILNSGKFMLQSKLRETCQKWKFKVLKNKFTNIKNIVIFIYNWQDRFKMNKIKYCNIKAFYKTRGEFSYHQWNYLQRGYIDIRRSGDISIQIRLYTFRSFLMRMKCSVSCQLPETLCLPHDLESN